MKTSITHLDELLHIRSNRLLVEEVCASLLEALRAFTDLLLYQINRMMDMNMSFLPWLSLLLRDNGKMRRTSCCLLRPSSWNDCETLGEEASHQCEGFKPTFSVRGEGVEMEFFGMGSSQRCCWQSLYKPPVDKRTGDYKWRIVHGAIATNRYQVHFNPGTGGSCPYCSQTEIIYHLFIQWSRLVWLFSQLQSWFERLGEHFVFEEICTHTNKCYFTTDQVSHLEKPCEEFEFRLSSVVLFFL